MSANPAVQAEFYDTQGHLHYVITFDLGYDSTTWNIDSFNETFAHVIPFRLASHSFARYVDNPTRPGYRFVEWELVSGSVQMHHGDGNVGFGNLSENTHVLAIWEEGDDIPIPPTAPLLVPSHNSPDTAYIDLAAETVTLPITVGAYSVNAGRSWRVGALPTGDGFSKLLGRGITLWVAQGYDKKAKRPTGATFNFPTIDRRPKANLEKLRVHRSDTAWDLRTKDGVLPAATYQWANTTDRKKPSGAWQPLNDGLPPLPGAKQRLTVLVRTPPSVTAATATSPARYVPAGRTWRAAVKG